MPYLELAVFHADSVYQSMVDDAAGGGKDVDDDSRHQHPGDEIGQIDQGLGQALEPGFSDFVEHQRQDKGHQQICDQLTGGDDYRVPHGPAKVRIGE